MTNKKSATGEINSIKKQFQKENGMTVEQAWEKVKEWKLAGKNEEALKGAQIILSVFPEHEAKDLAAKITASNQQEETPTTASHSSLSAQSSSKKSIAEKLGGKIADSMEEVLQKAKKQSQNSQPVPTSNQQPAALKAQNNQKNTPQPETVLDDERLFGALSYAWLLCLISLVLKKDSSFVQFHAKQGLVMAVVITLFDLTIGSLLNIVSPGFGFFFKVLYLGFLAFAAYQAYQGKRWHIPVVHGLAEKIKL